VQIGAVGKTGFKRTAPDQDVDVELRHYTHEEYKHLTNPQKLKLKLWREEQANSSGKGTAFSSKAKTSAVGQRKKPTTEATKKKPPPKSAMKTSNRNNGALIKQVTHKRGDDHDEDMEQS
jgi:hypothetical protein